MGLWIQHYAESDVFVFLANQDNRQIDYIGACNQ